MKRISTVFVLTSIGAMALLVANCADESYDETGGGGTAGTGGTGGSGGEVDGVAVDISAFDPDGLAEPITEVECTLTNGETSTCYQITYNGVPSDHDVGPWCPTHISDGPEAGGVWLDGGEVYDLDGSFIENLATFYDDPNWSLFDSETGAINVTDTQEGCAAAAQPNVPEEWQNYCVECELSYVDGGISNTVLIPKVPVSRDTPLELTYDEVGLSLSGVHFNLPAPLANILGAYTIAAFDDCGGHINLVVGYHYHTTNGCSREVAQDDGHSPLIGYARDGYGIYGQTNSDGVEPSDLDECRGHEDSTRGYHYHVASSGENLFIGCYHGEVADDGTTGDQGGELVTCDEVPAGSPCCGDGVCDGPETTENCGEDC